MQPETEQTITELLQYVKEGVERGAEFVSEQAPLVAQEIVLRGRIFHTIMLSIGVALLVYAGVAIRGAFKHGNAMMERPKGKEYKDGAPMSVYIGTGGLALLFGAGMFLANLPRCITVWVAPRLYVLDYLRGLL